MSESIELPVSQVSISKYGKIAIDGNLDDWQATDRLDNFTSQQVAGYRVYGKNTNDGYVLAIDSTQTEIGANTTVWVNADLDRSTGYQVFGFSVGAEYNLNFDASGTPYLYSGAAGDRLLGRLDFARSSDGKTVEIVIPQGSINSSSRAIDLNIDVNDRVFLPGDYTNSLRLYRDELPQRTNNSQRIAIVYSETSANNYFDKKAYSQLFANAQSQAIGAGVPYDLLSETDLKDLNRLVNYDALVFPSFINVDRANLDAIESSIAQATKSGVGIVTSGDFMTNDETGAALAGDPYSRMKNLLGIERIAGGGMPNAVIRAKDVNNDIISSGYRVGDELINYDRGTAFAAYNPVGTGSNILAEQTVGGENYNAIIATKTGGRNVHFANQSIFADSNIVGRSIQQSRRFANESIVYKDKTRVSLDLTRNSSLFISRDDVDLSRFANEAPNVSARLTNVLADWKAKYGFVGTHFINIGNDRLQGEYTDWNVMAPIYQQWLALGNEIGTHSYTHPDNPSNLSPAEVEFEFNQSRDLIAQQLGINITGAATPGNPDSLALDRQLDRYFHYYTGVGTAYNNAFGRLEPRASAIYFAPNISFDFNAIGYRKLTNSQTATLWQSEYNQLKNRSRKPIIEFAWHDYGATGTDAAYDPNIYTNFIATAAADGTEFVTFDDAQNRLRTFEKTNIITEQNGDTITAQIKPDANTVGLGKFSLDIQSNQQIKNVGNYYAFDRDSVFLSKTGGNYTINLGSGTDNVTHIVSLPQRAELLSVVGDGENLDYSFNGEGKIALALNSSLATGIVATGADSYNLMGNRLEMNFATAGNHSAKVAFGTALGTTGNDLILGSGGAIVGVDINSPNPSNGEIDTLVGARAIDRFILGDVDRVYYNRGNDYAKILGFSIAGGDIIQLKGNATDYSLGEVATGTAIYHNTLDTTELIGIVENAAELNLNSAYFNYVT